LTSSHRRTKTFLVAAVAALALTALVASSASAAIVPAKFSSSNIKMTTTGITVKRSNLEPNSCTLNAPGYSAFALGNEFYGDNDGVGGTTVFSCPSGKAFSFFFNGKATYDTVTAKYTITLFKNTELSLWSPWGNYKQSSEATAAWVNGSGATASTVTFNNPTLGLTSEGGKPISIEGTFKATTSTGGLLTLSH
jgi:hypothetical protein